MSNCRGFLPVAITLPVVFNIFQFHLKSARFHEHRTEHAVEVSLFLNFFQSLLLYFWLEFNAASIKKV